MMLSLFFPAEAVFPQRWSIEPLAYIGLAGSWWAWAWPWGCTPCPPYGTATATPHNGADDWSRLTEKQFETFQHDLGRPMRRILGKCREVRGVLASTGEDVSVVVHELLDEIEEQARPSV